MGGFPTRPNRVAFGPDYEDERAVQDTKREIGAGIFNLSFWQLAGIGRVIPKAVLFCAVAGSACTTTMQLLSFDPNGMLGLLTWTYDGVGEYSIAFASQYPDELGNNVNLSLTGGIALATGATPLPGSVEMSSGYEATINFASDPAAFVVIFW
jgi:hypothetical protein